MRPPQPQAFHIETGDLTRPEHVALLQRMAAARVLPIAVRPPVSPLATLLAILLPGLHRSRSLSKGYSREEALRAAIMAQGGLVSTAPEGAPLRGSPVLLPVDNPEWAAHASMRDYPPRPLRHTDEEVL